MLSEEKVKKLLEDAQRAKATAKCSGTDVTYRLWCKAEHLLKKILEIEPKNKFKRFK